MRNQTSKALDLRNLPRKVVCRWGRLAPRTAKQVQWMKTNDHSPGESDAERVLLLTQL